MNDLITFAGSAVVWTATASALIWLCLYVPWLLTEQWWRRRSPSYKAALIAVMRREVVRRQRDQQGATALIAKRSPPPPPPEPGTKAQGSVTEERAYE